MTRNSLLLLALLLPALSRGQEKRYKDTAGTYLKQVAEAVRKDYGDAELIGVTGRSDETGSALCDPKSPAADGWIYHFYSAAYDAAVLMAQCQGYVIGPLKEYVTSAKDTKVILGRFTDSDEALRDLAENGVSLEPGDHGASGKRPFSFKLMAVEDRRFADKPLFWQVTVGSDLYMLNAMTRKVEQGVAIRLDRAPDGSTREGDEPGSRAAKPGGSPRPRLPGEIPGRKKKPKGYTALRDMDAVKRLARQKLPGAVLMAVDGIADAWGHLDCTGPGDGWYYYFYWPKTKAIEAVTACNGEVSQGQGAYIPVSLDSHKELPGDPYKIDSDRAMDGLLTDRGGVMNEGMGRFYTRRVPMRLYQYKASPLTSPALWKKTFLWEVSIGASVYWVDAVTGGFVAEKK